MLKLTRWRLGLKPSNSDYSSDSSTQLPLKARRVLHGIGIALMLIIFRLWYLTAVAHADKLEEARRPQQRVVVAPAKRGTIRDRYNLPLAINKVQYQATIIYSQLQQIPTCVWQRNTVGERIKCYRRRTYITQLAQLLARELDLDPLRVEDLIHSKASLYHQVPFVIKDNLTEKEYYRLKMLERQWLGINAHCVPSRHYPYGRVGADCIGYLGSIDRTHYESILQEIRSLSLFIDQSEAGEDPLPLKPHLDSLEAAQTRLKELRELAYTINDRVGKAGIEKRFEELLRGFQGKRSYFSDARGNFLRELPGGYPPQSGKRLLLSISAELQAFAEELLIANEQVRQARISKIGSLDQSQVASKQPWVKGGSIIALDPMNGEVLALASYPRFDPNDFNHQGDSNQRFTRHQRLNRWLENNHYLADLWDQRMPLMREVQLDEKSPIYEEERWISWQQYLNSVLPTTGPLKDIFNNTITTLYDAHSVSSAAETLHAWIDEPDFYLLLNALYPNAISYGNHPLATHTQAINNKLIDTPIEVTTAKITLDSYIERLDSNYDKTLAIDLCRLVTGDNSQLTELLPDCGSFSLDAHRRYCCLAAALRTVAYNQCRQLYHDRDFALWRQENGKEFLNTTRQMEKDAGKYAQPYIDIFDKQERLLFENFWQEHRDELLAALLLGSWGALPDDSPAIYYCLKLKQQHHQLLSNTHDEEWYSSFVEIHEALASLPPWVAIEYIKSLRSYQDLTRPLLGRYRSIRRHADGQQCEQHLAAGFYPLYGYGYGRSYAYRQATTPGSIFKLITAYAALAKHCQNLDTSSLNTKNLNPLTIVDCVERRDKGIIVGYAEDGTPIPQHYKGGRLPKSLKRRIGHLDITQAIVTSSNPYFGLLAGDVLDNPDDLSNVARLFSYGKPTGIALPGEISGNVPTDLAKNRTGLYATAIGQHTLVVTPLQSAVMLAALANYGKILKPKIAIMAAGSGSKAQPSPVVQAFSDEIIHQAWLPEPVQNLLLDAMRQVAIHMRDSSLRSLKKLYKAFPSAMRDYVSIGDQLIGKTSTAESVEVLDLELNTQGNLYNHVSFSGVVMQPNNDALKATPYLIRNANGTPELVIIVYLRYGGYGKDATPIAAQIAQRWRSIKAQHASKN
jgi:cell division protein FtsI/penicillin-binding protein 2